VIQVVKIGYPHRKKIKKLQCPIHNQTNVEGKKKNLRKIDKK